MKDIDDAKKRVEESYAETEKLKTEYDKMNQETQDMIKTLRGENTASRLDSVWKELQTHVDHVIDRWSLGLSSRVVIISLFAGI